MTTRPAAAFHFSTKAGNLAQLAGRLRCGVVLPQEVLLVGEWVADRGQVVARLARRFDGAPVIVRSSAPGEDSIESSMAGAFESRGHVPSHDTAALEDAVEAVVASYVTRGAAALDGHEVLVQPMVRDVRASGVVFTRDLDNNGPYYVLNFEESDRTDGVTAGIGDSQRLIRIFKEADSAGLDTLAGALVRMARELEDVTGNDAIDIEFAVDGAGDVYVLQVRPLSRTRILSLAALDRRVAAELREAREFVTAKLRRLPHLFGETTVFGEMPDWNPAEMIGTHPKPLAASLYRYLILKSAWREARGLIGYRHPFPYHLLVEVCGRPYVDVRCSFNSFLPAGLSDVTCEKLVNYYTRRLRQHPELHDKIEFEIVISCLAFDFDVHAERLADAGFSIAEIDEVRGAALELTDGLVCDRAGVLSRLKDDVMRLEARRSAALASRDRNDALPMIVEQLLDDCVRYGTVPFSVFARCAFVATAFLRSLVHRGVWSAGDYDRYLHAIETVAGEFVADLDAWRAGRLGLDAFLGRYGHLRPGTYDINAPTYAERPDLYLGVGPDAPGSGREASRGDGTSGTPPQFPAHIGPPLQALLREHGFTCSVQQLNRFVVRSIQLREAVKFEFTKNLSAALALLVEFGKYHGLTRADLAFVPVETFLELANRSMPSDWLLGLRDTIDRNRKRYELTCAINLPDLLCSARDLEVVSLQSRRPNFITQKRVVAPSAVLIAGGALEGIDDLRGRIVLVENADPGYDWLFAKGIAGLVTKYGGAASHMTIRCAEFGLPAAIGCGEQIFRQLSTAAAICLDCAERQVRPNAT